MSLQVETESTAALTPYLPAHATSCSLTVPMASMLRQLTAPIPSVEPCGAPGNLAQDQQTASTLWDLGLIALPRCA